MAVAAGPSYPVMVRMLFLVMFAGAPAFVFLFQAFLVAPPLLIFGAIIARIPDAFHSAQSAESLTFMALFALHLAIFAGFYHGLARGLALLIARIGDSRRRSATLALVLGAVAAVALLPVYGFGVLTSPNWGSLALVLAKVNDSYGSHAAAVIYASYGVFAGAWLLLRRRRRSAGGGDRASRRDGAPT